MGNSPEAVLGNEISSPNKLVASPDSSSMDQHIPVTMHGKRPLKETERFSRKKQHHCEWSEASHRKFVAEIFEVGMLHASPTLIQQYMLSNVEGLTSEKIKSHLQKFRNKQEKSKEEFMSLYDEIYTKLKMHYIKSCEDCANSSDDQQGRNTSVCLPCLSDKEIETPFGASLELLKGLYYSFQAELSRHSENSS
jgi:SHAQKYF class myb-like DNA-binding protein